MNLRHAILLIALVGVCVSQQVVRESGTDLEFESSFDSCNYAEGGYIYALGWTYTSVMVYKCDTASNKEYSLYLKIYTSWVTNYVYKTAIGGILDTKNNAGEYIIPRNDRDVVMTLVNSITDTLYSGNEIRITFKNGDTSILFNGVEKARTTQVQFSSMNSIVPLFGSAYHKTL